MQSTDTRELKNRLHASGEQFIYSLFPGAKKLGHNIVIGDIAGNSGKSLSIAVNKGYCWSDFATGESGSDLIQLARYKWGGDFNEIIKKIQEWLGVDHQDNTPEIVTYYDYTTTTGDLLVRIKRFDKPYSKRFLQVNSQDNLLDINKQFGTKRPLYALPLVDKCDIIVVCEGEKDAEAINQLAHPKISATTAMLGSNKSVIEKTDWLPLEDKQVVIWPDNDEKGATYGRMLFDHLKSTHNVNILTVDESWSEKAGAADVLPTYQDGDNGLESLIMGCLEGNSIKCYSLRDIVESKIDIPDPLMGDEFLCPGEIMLIAGAPKSMKSLYLQQMLVNGALGRNFLGFKCHRPFSSMWFQAELSLRHLKNRVGGLNLTDSELEQVDNQMRVTSNFSVLFNDEGLIKAKNSVKMLPGGKPDVIAIDPLANVFSGNSENDNTEVCKFLTRLKQFRDEVNPEAALVMVHHAKKPDGHGGNTMDKVRGASAFYAYVDSMVFIRPIADGNPKRRVNYSFRGGMEPAPQTIEYTGSQFIDCEMFEYRKA